MRSFHSLSVARKIKAARTALIIIPSLSFCVLSFTTAGCERDIPKKTPTVWDDAAYKADYVAKHRRASYEIENTSATPEAAVQQVLDAFCKPDGEPAKWIFSKSEQQQIIWPNLPAADLPGAVNNPDAYWEVLQTMRSVVWPRMEVWRGACMKVLRIPYRRDPEQYGEILLHYPGEIEVLELDTGKKTHVDFIRDIAEHQHRFKVSQVGPD